MPKCNLNAYMEPFVVIQLAKQLAQMDSIRKSILQKAFDLIDTNVSPFLCSLGH